LKRFVKIAAAASVALTLGACTTGQLNVPPPINFTPVSAVLHVSVGTVNFAGAAVGLNVLETDRAPSGYTAIPVNTATLTGPGGFTGAAGSADPGSGSASVPMGAAADSFPVASFTTNMAAADGFGVGPPGSSSASVSPFPVQPQFFDAVGGAATAFSAQRALYGAPPAYPAASGNTGFPEGFYLLALSGAPPTGVYTLTVSYVQNSVSGSQSATATLSSNVPLATLPAPTYAGDGLGGGSGSITVPGGVSEVLINFTDTGPGNTGARATLVVHGSGVHAYNVPNSMQFHTGDALRIQAFGFDFNDFELGPPNNLSQSPPLPAQADVTVAAQVNTVQ
jgi:hypothetical protein